jgi:PKD repeat protein
MASRSWDFGDNSVDVPQLRRNQVLTHTYNASGSFNVTLKVGLDGDVGTMQETFSSVIKIASGTLASALAVHTFSDLLTRVVSCRVCRVVCRGA